MVIRNAVIPDICTDRIDSQRFWVWLEGGVVRDMAPEQEGTEYLPQEKEGGKAENILDAQGMILLPGMANAHYHSYSNIVKGFSDGAPLEVWSPETVALGGNMTREEAVMSAQIGICEMLHLGITSCLDHIPHLAMTEALGEAYEMAGFRAALAPMIHDLTDGNYLWGIEEEKRGGKGKFLTPEEYMEYYRDIKEKFCSNSLISLQAGLNSPQRCSDEMLSMAGKIVKELDLNVHSHLLETRWQAETAKREGNCPVERMEKYGLLSERTSLAHCVHLTERQKEKIAGNGARIVINTTSNLFLGSGIAPVWEYEKMGIPFCYGSDGENCSFSMNLLEAMRLSLLFHRSLFSDMGDWMEVKGAYKKVSLEGACITGSIKSFSKGKEGRAGIEKGAPADLILADRKMPGMWPENRGMFQLLFQAPLLSPAHVLIGGKQVVKDYKILSVQEEKLKKKLEDTAKERLDRLHRAADASRSQARMFLEMGRKNRLYDKTIPAFSISR